MKCQPIVGPGGRVVAVLVGDALTKNVEGSRHFLKNPPAIALDAGAIAQADAAGVTQIAITDTETGRCYHASLTELYGHGWRFNRGYGDQIAMRLTRWHVEGDQVKHIESPAPERPPVARQLAFWGTP